MKICQATLADLPDILSVNKLAFKFGAAATYNEALTAHFVDVFLPSYYKDSFIQTKAFETTYLVKSNQSIISIGCHVDNEIFFLHTHPNYFGKGYGSYMLNFLEKKISKTHQHIELLSLLNAVRFYECKGYTAQKSDFIDMGEHRLPAIRMVKTI